MYKMYFLKPNAGGTTHQILLLVYKLQAFPMDFAFLEYP